MPPLTRREFMKTFGAGLAALAIAGCRLRKQDPAGSKDALAPTPPIMVGCYEPKPVEDAPTPTALHTLSPRDQLRACWLSFNELAAKTQSGENAPQDDPFSNPLGGRLSVTHRAALGELVAAGELDSAVADLVQEAYDAAVYHIWRSEADITCYIPMMVDYAPFSAAQLVEQSAVLADLAAKGNLNPETVAVVQKKIQHDLAFEALSQAEVDALYDRLLEESQQAQAAVPAFAQVELEVTPEIEAAARFIIELLGEDEK